MPVNTSSDSNTWLTTMGSRRMRNCVTRRTLSARTRVLGKVRSSSRALANATADSTQNAARHPKASEISTPMGMPNTVAATMPKATVEMARPARAGPTSSTAVALASDQNTGSASAGTKRAIAMIQMLGATAASALDSPNSTSTPMNRRLRSMLAMRAVSRGPVAATVKANSVTSRPAWETVTFRSRASPGKRPTIRNSVVRTVKPAAERSRMGKSIGIPWARGRKAPRVQGVEGKV
ncbi:hypothetical protein LMG26686_03009 [Achromobacter mucicolens]|nr:hypothetical protein LMG26686_03009 [Achromobacter mucicolens]